MKRIVIKKCALNYSDIKHIQVKYVKNACG